MGKVEISFVRKIYGPFWSSTWGAIPADSAVAMALVGLLDRGKDVYNCRPEDQLPVSLRKGKIIAERRIVSMRGGIGSWRCRSAKQRGGLFLARSINNLPDHKKEMNVTESHRSKLP